MRVVNNISGSRSKALDMYTKDFSKLIFFSCAQEDFIFKLRIHHSIFSKGLKSGSIYLGKYVFTDKPVEGGTESNLSEKEVLALLDADRLEASEDKKVGRKVTIRSIKDKSFIKVFNSISGCILFLNNLDILSSSANGSSTEMFSKTTLYRYIKTGNPYYGFICQWTEDGGSHVKDKSIEVEVLHIPTGNVSKYPTIRKAALSFDPVTTGQTMKSYMENAKIFRGEYRISYSKNRLS